MLLTKLTFYNTCPRERIYHVVTYFRLLPFASFLPLFLPPFSFPSSLPPSFIGQMSAKGPGCQTQCQLLEVQYRVIHSPYIDRFLTGRGQDEEAKE